MLSSGTGAVPFAMNRRESSPRSRFSASTPTARGSHDAGAEGGDPDGTVRAVVLAPRPTTPR